MPHICHITTAHPTFGPRIFRRECVSLARIGHRVSLITIHPTAEVVQGVNIVPLPRPSSKLERRLIHTNLAARTALRLNADIYHFHDLELIFAMKWLARRSGKPVIWDAHENYVGSIQHFNPFYIPFVSKLAAKWLGELEIHACRNDFSGVVTINDFMAERYRAHGIPTSSVDNSVDIETISFPTKVQRSPKPRLISAGTQSTDRGIFEIIDAFRIVRRMIPCEIAFWGSFEPPSIRDVLFSRATADGIPSSDVIFGGPYEWETLVEELIPTAWAGCVLFDPKNQNNIHALPNRFFELWANGVPVFATAGTLVAKIVSQEEGGFVIEDNDPRSIAEAFIKLAKDPLLTSQLGMNGRKSVEEKYNWSNAFQQLLKLYASLEVKI